MWKWITVSFISILTLTGCNLDTKSVSQVEVFEDMEELAQKAPIVIIGKGTSENEEFEYHGVIFFKSKIEVIDIFRDDENELAKNSTITLLQNGGEFDPLVKKNEKALLFLKKYRGPMIDHAYRIVGLKQGHYKVKDGELISLAEKRSKLYNNSEGMTIDDLKNLLQSNPYKPVHTKKRSEKEIKEMNEKEKQMLEQHEKDNGE